MIIFMEVAIGAMAAALIAVPFVMAATGKKDVSGERQAR